MTIGFSTSSAMASMAVFDAQGVLLHAESRMADRRSSGACLDMLHGFLEREGLQTSQIAAWVADVGPGSFTGIKVGVTVVKALGFLHGVKVAGVSAFDLMPGDGPKAVPYKRGEWFVKMPGREPEVSSFVPADAVTYGVGVDVPIFPDVRLLGPHLERLQWVDASQFVPEYGADPSISLPKRPYAAESVRFGETP